MIAGVYLIRNLHTGDVYVGSSSRSIAKRWREHRRDLRGGRHCNPRLQNAWNKYGPDGFAWEVLEHAEGRETVLICEQRWIDHYWGGRMGVDCYNTLLTAGSREGYTATPETRAKLSAAGRGRVKSPEELAKMSAAGLGRVHSPETRAKMSAAHTGRVVSPETLAKMRGRVHSPETRAKISARSASPETRAKISAGLRGRVHSPETRAKISAAGRGRTISPETRAKLRGRVRSPETRAKMSASLRERQRKLRGKATYHQASLFDLAE